MRTFISVEIGSLNNIVQHADIVAHDIEQCRNKLSERRIWMTL